MPLSITQRLTLTAAVLGMAIVAPACIAIYRSSARGVEARALERAGAKVSEVGLAIVNQLDEDILVDFAREPIDYHRVYVPFHHWAVVRRDGTLEASQGLFRESLYRGLGSVPKIERYGGERSFALASRPLFPERERGSEDLPPELLDGLRPEIEGGTFLHLKRERSGDLTLFIGKWLFPDHILEIEMSETGEVVDLERDPLPNDLPPGLSLKTRSGEVLRNPRLVRWQAHDHQLIALVEGQGPGGRRQRVAVNALGEHYEMRSDGLIDPMREASRLWVVVAHDLSAEVAQTRQVGRVTAGAGLALWLLIVTMTHQVTRRALRPVKAMVNQAERIDPAQLDKRLPIRQADDELSQIARTVNGMLDRIEAGYHRERQFTGDASHEMRNPLAKMIAEIDLALSQPRRPDTYRATLERLRVYAQSMQQLTESLLMLARLDGELSSIETHPFDVAELAMDVLRPFSRHSARRIRLELGDTTTPILAVGHRHLIGVMLGNLVDNALRYSPTPRPVFLRIQKNCKVVHFDVEDQGPGIPEDQLSLAFDRFYRLDKSRSKETGGLGLGLSIVQAIARVHGAEVALTRGATRGTHAWFSLPCATDAADGNDAR